MTLYNEIEPLTLEIIPEIWEEYVLELGLTETTVRYEDWIRKLYQIPKDDNQRLGPTIVFESLLAPLIISLLEDSNHGRLQEAFDWLESIAKNQEGATLVEVTICESFLSNYSNYFHRIYPYVKSMPTLLRLFKKASKRFRMDEELMVLLNKGQSPC